MKNLRFSVERPLAGAVKKNIAVAAAALVVRPGSSFSRRQPALASVLHFVWTWICYVRCLRFRLPPAKHSPSPSGSRLSFSQIQQTAKRSNHRTRSLGQRSLPKTVQFMFFVERPAAGSVKKIIDVAPAALVVRPGSSSSRRQPALSIVLRFAADADLLDRCLRYRLSPVKHSPPRRSGSRLCHSQPKQTAKRSSHRTRNVGQRSLPLRRHQLLR